MKKQPKTQPPIRPFPGESNAWGVTRLIGEPKPNSVVKGHIIYDPQFTRPAAERIAAILRRKNPPKSWKEMAAALNKSKFPAAEIFAPKPTPQRTLSMPIQREAPDLDPGVDAHPAVAHPDAQSDSRLIVAFVQGVEWFEHRKTGATLWPADRQDAENEAARRALDKTLGERKPGP